MQIFSAIVSILISAFLIWTLMRYYKADPEAFSLKNLNKSFLTMGVLALGLIVAIAFVVILLKR